MANLALGTIVAQLVLVAKDVFAASDAQVGVFATALGIGGAIVSLLAGPPQALPLVWIPPAGLPAALWRAHHRARLDAELLGRCSAVGCMFGMIGFFDTAFPAIVQASAPNEVLGRVTTFIEMLAVLSVPLSAVLGGWIIDRAGSVSLVFGILGGFVALVALAFLGSPLAHVERYLPQAPEVAAEAVSSP